MVDGDNYAVVKNAFAYCFKEARLATTGGSDNEHKKSFGQISTIMRALTSKYEDLLSQYDKIDQSAPQIDVK